MVKEIMRRKAADNIYLHKDFHGAMSTGIDYLERCYGAAAVNQYLREFTTSFYAPLNKALKERGLIALKEYFEKVYELEGGKVRITLSEGELVIVVEFCPAITHLREKGYHVARLFCQTTKIMNEVICEGTPYLAELFLPEEESGRCIQRFYRRES
jgi:hypothetical protein